MLEQCILLCSVYFALNSRAERQTEIDIVFSGIIPIPETLKIGNVIMNFISLRTQTDETTDSLRRERAEKFRG